MRLADDDRDRARHGRLPLARAGSGRAGGAGQRPLRARGRRVRAPHRAAAVRVGQPDGGGGSPRAGGDAVDLTRSSIRSSGGRWPRSRRGRFETRPSSWRRCGTRSTGGAARDAHARPGATGGRLWPLVASFVAAAALAGAGLAAIFTGGGDGSKRPRRRAPTATAPPPPRATTASSHHRRRRPPPPPPPTAARGTP